MCSDGAGEEETEIACLAALVREPGGVCGGCGSPKALPPSQPGGDPRAGTCALGKRPAKTMVREPGDVPSAQGVRRRCRRAARIAGVRESEGVDGGSQKARGSRLHGGQKTQVRERWYWPRRPQPPPAQGPSCRRRPRAGVKGRAPREPEGVDRPRPRGAPGLWRRRPRGSRGARDRGQGASRRADDRAPGGSTPCAGVKRRGRAGKRHRLSPTTGCNRESKGA